ncbi:MAG: family acetyltransferase [Phycisphaerales bacterium]|nr:family acetyltransferase [Phycisphaerales bacterium]
MPDPLPLRIRLGTSADADTLAEFNSLMALETEGHALEPTIIGPGVAAALADPHKAIYFVADIGGRVVGQLMVTHEWSDWRNGDIWWVQSVFVHPDHRRKGVFRALYNRSRIEAKKAGAVGVRLYVEENNGTAQATYRQLGMGMTHYRVMEEMFG